mmetsp:Transcript_39373/g.84905  ORF Transcript_39373/g.84905 Transcript_39373/m.84905 type:complete len:936 (-) Transcript_39373:392-3199(-)
MSRKWYASSPSILLLLLAPFQRLAFADVTRGTVIIKRGADANSITSTFLDDVDVYATADEARDGSSCTSFDGIISFAHPMSLMEGDKFFSTGQLQLKSIEMMVDEINSQRCGVGVDGKRYGIELTTYGDDSSKDKVGAIVENGMLPIRNSTSIDASFWLGPYSSGLTGKISPHANATNTILVAGGAASTPVFRDNPTIFGTFPPTSKYLAQAIKALAEAGARTVSSVWEDASFTRGVCAALDALAQEHGLEIKSQTEVPSSPSVADLDPVARNLSMSETDPDVVVTCVYAEACANWISSLRGAKWSPKAQVFTVCIGMDSFQEAVGLDAMYMTGISPWDPSLPTKDDVVGWSASEFAESFFSYTSRTATYHSASAAASVGALVQAIERSDSFDSDRIASILSSEEFTTLYGKLSFDGNGQSKAPSLFLQYNENATVQTVYPLESRSGDLVYPMPTWEHRDCSFLSRCETGSPASVPGACREDGSCECEDSEAISSGIGPDASCIIVPSEDIGYVSASLVALGLSLFSIQAIMSLSCAAWTVRYRSTNIVRGSQPIFLCLVCFGAFVMNLAMLPIGIQGKYRYVQDPMTGEVTDVPNPDISRVDAACMAVPWLFSMGFSILFSALFAKIWRVRMVLKAAARFKRKTVQPKDVAIIMVCVVAIQAVILLCWQLIDPMRWQREIISSDYNGYSTKSVGYCQSNRVLRFLTPLIVIDGMMLLYALHLCFVTRNVSSDLQEGHWITGAVLSIIQILIISIPILIITENNNDAFYFVRSAIIFLMSSTVTALIFFPKMYRLHFARHQRRNATSSAMSRPSVVSQIRASAASASAQRDSLRSFPSNASAQDTGMPARWGNDFQSSNYKASVENNDGVNNDDPGGGNSEVVDDRTRISTQNASSSNDCDTKAVLSERSSSSKALDNGDDDDNTTGDAQAKSCQ